MSLRGLAASSAFHAVILILLVFGLPSFLDPEPLPQPLVMSVEIHPVGPTNIKNQDTAPKKKTEEPPKPREEVKKPVKQEEVKKEEPKKEEKKPEPKPEPVPEPVKKEEKKEEKKEQKKEEAKTVEEPSLDDILKDLKKAEKKPPAPKVDSPVGTPDDGKKAISESAFDQNSPQAMALQDNIRSQIMPCWLYTGGAPEDKIKAAKILVSVNPDGSIASAKLHGSQAGEYKSNGYFRAIVDSAIRATRNGSCTPLKNLPAGQYHMWKELVVTFDPRVML
ncbi:MAG: hypothetical protein FJX23_03705 [Alphaproteobacteria bacterium]|nr:hypothetical protein [Alphaproteobacteria bacterium]